MEDVRPELELEPVPAAAEVTESHKAASAFSKLAHDWGSIAFRIKELEAEVEDLFIKMRNSRIDYLKAKQSETSAHSEATNPQGVTQ